MGLDDRVPFDQGQFSQDDPRDRAVSQFATQPPLGCRYYYSGSTYQTLTADTATSLDFRADAGNILYDPYNMISVANDNVTIPQPGVSDIYSAAVVQSLFGSNDVYAHFAQGTGTINLQLEGSVTDYHGAAGDYMTLIYADQLLITRAQLGAGATWSLGGYTAGHANDFKIRTFSMWLRSANIPSKY